MAKHKKKRCHGAHLLFPFLFYVCHNGGDVRRPKTLRTSLPQVAQNSPIPAAKKNTFLAGFVCHLPSPLRATTTILAQRPNHIFQLSDRGSHCLITAERKNPNRKKVVRKFLDQILSRISPGTFNKTTRPQSPSVKARRHFTPIFDEDFLVF